jgi:hypothetical protein
MKSLRADLASAARDARTDARDTGRTIRTESSGARSESRSNLQDAEALLQGFRAQIRSDLRDWIVQGDLGAPTIAVLKTGLEDVRTAVKASLRDLAS